MSNRDGVVIENSPLSSAVVVAITVLPPINKLTVLPASAVPAIVGLELFVSVVVVVIAGCSGAVASIVIDKASDDSDVLSASSVAVTVNE